MFARKADDSLASFAKRLDDMVVQNQDKKACATVVMLGTKDEFAPKLESFAKDKKIEHVPLTVADDGAAGPGDYAIGKDVPVTVVVYDKKKKVTATFAFDSLDAASQNKAIAEFAKAIGVEPPKNDEKK